MLMKFYTVLAFLVFEENLEDTVKKLDLTIYGLNEKLRKSEQNREHWRLECQLLQLKLGKIQDTNISETDEKTFVNEKIQIKIDDLVSEKLFADSKATHFYLESLALQKRIRFWEKAKIKAQNDLKEAQNQIEVIKEEAKTTSVNYENQLSLMSEHLANMNDKLTKQTDEIERLKFEVGNKKKGSK